MVKVRRVSGLCVEEGGGSTPTKPRPFGRLTAGNCMSENGSRTKHPKLAGPEGPPFWARPVGGIRATAPLGARDGPLRWGFGPFTRVRGPARCDVRKKPTAARRSFVVGGSGSKPAGSPNHEVSKRQFVGTPPGRRFWGLNENSVRHGAEGAPSQTRGVRRRGRTCNLGRRPHAPHRGLPEFGTGLWLWCFSGRWGNSCVPLSFPQVLGLGVVAPPHRNGLARGAGMHRSGHEWLGGKKRSSGVFRFLEASGATGGNGKPISARSKNRKAVGGAKRTPRAEKKRRGRWAFREVATGAKDRFPREGASGGAGRCWRTPAGGILGVRGGETPPAGRLDLIECSSSSVSVIVLWGGNAR